MNTLERLLQTEWLPVLRGIQTADAEKQKARKAIRMVTGIPKKERDSVGRHQYLNAFEYFALSPRDQVAYNEINRDCRGPEIAQTTLRTVQDLGKKLPRELVRHKKGESQYIGRGDKWFRYRLYAHAHPSKIDAVYEKVIDALVDSGVEFDSKVMTHQLAYNGPGIVLPQFNGIVLYVGEGAGRVALRALQETKENLLDSSNPFTAHVLRGVGIAECLIAGGAELHTSFDVPKYQAIWNIAKNSVKVPEQREYEHNLGREMKKVGRQPGQYHLIDDDLRPGVKNSDRRLYCHYVETLRDDLRRKNDAKTMKK